MRMSKNLFSHPLFLVLGSAILYIVSYDAPAYAWPLGFVALVPLFFFLRNEQSLKRVFRYGFLFGVVTIAGVIVWFLSTYPLEWAGIGNKFVGAAIAITVWTLTSILLGLFFGLFAVLFKKLARNDWHDILIAPSLWVLMEFARAFFLSLLFLGNQSSLGPDWIFGFFGYSLVWSRVLAYLAPWGGVYLLSFVGVAMNCALFLALYRMRQGKTATKFFVVVGVLAALYIANQVVSLNTTRAISGDTKTIAIVTTNFPATFSQGFLNIGEQANTIERLLGEAVQSSPDIIVLPEDSYALPYLGTTTIQTLLEREKKEVMLIDSAQVSDALGTRERIFFYSSARGVVGTSDKTFLMPYGEYLPHIAVATARLFNFQEWLSAFDDVRGYQRGNIAVPISFDGHVLGVLFCSEIIPDSLYRKLAGGGADIFFNVASHADFHNGERILYNQTLSSAKMKAAANRRFFVQAGNYMPSFVLNERGEILGESVRGEDSVLLVKAGFNTTKTPYTRFGDWILLVAAFFVTFYSWRMQANSPLNRSRAFDRNTQSIS